MIQNTVTPEQITKLNDQMAAALKLGNKMQKAGLTLTITPRHENLAEDEIEGLISTADKLLIWKCRWNWRDNSYWSCSSINLVTSNNNIMEAFSS